jgi:hypothetical protein
MLICTVQHSATCDREEAKIPSLDVSMVILISNAGIGSLRLGIVFFRSAWGIWKAQSYIFQRSKILCTILHSSIRIYSEGVSITLATWRISITWLTSQFLASKD